MSWYKKPITESLYNHIASRTGEKILFALNWYKRAIIASGGISANIENVNGIQSVVLNGNTYPFREQIKQLGAFTYKWPVKDNQGKIIQQGFWWASLKNLRNSPQALDGLRQIGVQVDHFLQ